jgi:hypothetical protein
MTVAQLMLAMAFVATALTVLNARVADPGLALLAVGNLALIALVSRLALADRIHVGPYCPRCGRPTLGRVAVVPFGSRYYQCSSCGERRKRTWFLGVWQRALSKADAAHFRSHPGGGCWADPPVVVGESGPQGRLLHGKRSRLVGPGPDLGPLPNGMAVCEGPDEGSTAPPKGACPDLSDDIGPVSGGRWRQMEPLGGPARLLEGKRSREAARRRGPAA